MESIEIDESLAGRKIDLRKTRSLDWLEKRLRSKNEVENFPSVPPERNFQSPLSYDSQC